MVYYFAKPTPTTSSSIPSRQFNRTIQINGEYKLHFTHIVHIDGGGRNFFPNFPDVWQIFGIRPSDFDSQVN